VLYLYFVPFIGFQIKYDDDEVEERGSGRKGKGRKGDRPIFISKSGRLRLRLKTRSKRSQKRAS